MTTLEYLVNVKKLTSACLDRSLFTCDNWRRYALDFLSLGGPDQYALRFDDDLRVLLRPNTTDKWVVQETMLRDDYRLRDMDLRQATVIDLGANIGVVSLRAAALVPHASSRTSPSQATTSSSPGTSPVIASNR